MNEMLDLLFIQSETTKERYVGRGQKLQYRIVGCIYYNKNITFKSEKKKNNNKKKQMKISVKPRYNDRICSQRCCHYNEFAVVKNPLWTE